MKDVELSVDDLGVTHVYAANDAYAFFGGGYAMARDPQATGRVTLPGGVQ